MNSVTIIPNGDQLYLKTYRVSDGMLLELAQPMEKNQNLSLPKRIRIRRADQGRA